MVDRAAQVRRLMLTEITSSGIQVLLMFVRVRKSTLKKSSVSAIRRILAVSTTSCPSCSTRAQDHVLLQHGRAALNRASALSKGVQDFR